MKKENVEEFTAVLRNSDDEEILQYWMKKIESIRQEAFMEGYRYAISILKESMVDKGAEP